MDKKFMFFISHRSSDNEYAKELYNFLRELNPEWEIFLDCSDKRPLESSVDWYETLMQNVKDSKYLIVIASKAERLKSTYVLDEIKKFRDDFENTKKYFGIFFSEQEFNKVLSFSETFSSYFKFQENLLLNEGETLKDAEERLKNKIVKMINDAADEDGEAAEIYDKVKRFAIEKERSDPMFNEKAIDEGLVPTFKNEGNVIDFTTLCKYIEDKNVAIIGAEGGCGKTTLLTKIFYHYLNNVNISDPNTMIPIYIDAKNLSAENFLVLRWLTKILYDEQDAMTSKNTSDKVGKLIKEFSKKTEKPRYLLIIDGYNEIPDSSIEKLNNELEECLLEGKYKNVRVLISGRHIGNKLSENAFCRVTISLLQNTIVSNYLKQKGLWTGKIKDSLFRILSIPMYLKMYVETSADEKIQSKADLLCSFIEWQQKKNESTANTDAIKKFYQICIEHILPVVAYHMLMKKQNDFSFVLTEEEYKESMSEIRELINSENYKSFYGRDYYRLISGSNFSQYDSFDLLCETINYFAHTIKLLREDKDGNVDFVHQIYRDFFCAWFIAEDIKRNIKKGKCSDLLSDRILNTDVLEFVSELLKEEKPTFDTEKCIWDYSCNLKSKILPMMDTLRENYDENSATAVSNIMEMLKYARAMDLSGLNLTYLDLTKCSLRTCQFYRCDKTAQYPTSFKGSKINVENIFTEKNFGKLNAVCTNETSVACVDETGTIKIWNKNNVVDFPIKIITNVRFWIRKMVFSRDNSSFIAMTGHMIIQIPISNEFYSKAQPKILFKSSKRLQDVIINENGEVLFTTNLNSFNYKSINNPDTADENNFYGINSAACINSKGNRLALGHIVGYDGLKIYDYVTETNKWKERKFGYSLVLDKFMREFEQALIKMNLYDSFPTDNEHDERRTYFLYIQQQFEDTNHNHTKTPMKIFRRCCKELKDKDSNLLSETQKTQLYNIAKRYEEDLYDIEKNNLPLLLISGRRVTGISFKRDSNMLLVSCAFDYKEKMKQTYIKEKDKKILCEKMAREGQYDNVVLEVDTDTFETRFITRYKGNQLLEASYSGNEIVLKSETLVKVYDEKNRPIFVSSTVPKSIGKIIKPDDEDVFYGLGQHFIYVFDGNLRCIKSVENTFRNDNVGYYKDSQGNRYFAKKTQITDFDKFNSIKAIDITNCRSCELSDVSDVKPVLNKKCDNVKDYSGKIVYFEDFLKKDELEIAYKLFVCGCDFSEVRGTSVEPQYRHILAHFGAITDDVQHIEVRIDKSKGTFIPSTKPFTIPKELALVKSPFSHCTDVSLEEDCDYSDAVGGNNLYDLKTWLLIDNGFYSRTELEDADFSILEQTEYMEFVTPTIIERLIGAGIIDKPVKATNIEQHLEEHLHKKYKVLFKSKFYINGVGVQNPIYTISYPYGEFLLKNFSVGKKKKLLGQDEREKQAKKKMPGKKQEHICIKDAIRITAIKNKLALNEWFSLIAYYYKQYLNDYWLYSKYETDSHIDGKAMIPACVCIGEQVFFVRAFRASSNVFEQVYKFCLLATYHNSLMRGGQPFDCHGKQPILILICENFEHCKEINSQIKDIYPHVRKIFTYDTLVCSKEAFEGAGNHFEFVDGVPFSVKLEDIFKS